MHRHLIATAWLLTIPLAAQSLVIPSVAANTDGNSSSGWPFDVATMRIQYIYDSSHFTSNGITFPIQINQIRYRANASNTTWNGSSGTLQMSLSTAPIDFAVITNTFASNHGPDLTSVFNGPFTVASGSSTTGTPGPYHVTVSFTTPFLYDPNAGDLTIETVHSGLTIADTPLLDLVNTAGVALARRMQTTTVGNATGTIWTGEAANVMEFGYTPASGLHASFTATPTSGASPLLVQFNDTSFTSDPGGILTWAWDFEDDGIVDSNLPNPSHAFGCGDFSVRLTVTDAVHGQSTFLASNLVNTDLPFTANFTASPLAPGVYQFTDTSSPPATAWAWDFDGDNFVDSTVPNPVWPLPSCAAAAVRLDVSRNCRTATVTKTLFFAPTSLNSNLTGGSGTVATGGVGNYFDVQVLAPEGISVCGLTSLTYTGTGPYTVSVYVTPDTYVGKDGTIAQWRLVATGQGTMSGGSTTTPSVNLIPLNQSFYLPQGNYGIAVYHVAQTGSSYIAYTSSVQGPYANADLVIHPNPATAPGISRQGFWSGSVWTPRPWNGAFHYTKTSLDGTAGYGVHSFGCTGSAGVPGNVVVTPPTVGGVLSVDFTNLPFGAALVLASQLRFNPGIDLGIVGAPGCPLYNNLDLQFVIVSASTTANLLAPIPADPLLFGQVYWVQALSLDVVNAFGFTTSDGAGTIIGG